MQLLKKLQIMLLYGSIGCWLSVMTSPSRQIGKLYCFLTIYALPFSCSPSYKRWYWFCGWFHLLECSSTFLHSFTLVSSVNYFFMDVLFFYDSSMCIVHTKLIIFSRCNAFSVGSTTLWEVSGSGWWKGWRSAQYNIEAHKYHCYQGWAISQGEEDWIKELFWCIVVSFDMIRR